MRVGVIMGGTSSEREISINSGTEIIKNLDNKRYEIIPIVLNAKEEILCRVKNIDFALLALHGKFGEDGTIQGILETLGIPYSGCGVLSSSMCMDKDITKRIVRNAGVSTADWVIVQDTKEIDYNEIDAIGYPVVVKPNSGGSSVATNIIKNQDEIPGAVIEALKYDKEVMIEKYIKGDEITCCLLNGRLLPILAIKPKATFFDYTSKYTSGGADEFVIELQDNLQQEVRSTALKCYNALKCSVYARVDMIVEDGKPYVLEVNTLPGMTKNSLFPKSAASAGIPFHRLLELLIEYSLKENR